MSESPPEDPVVTLAFGGAFQEKIKEVRHFEQDNLLGDAFILATNEDDAWDETLKVGDRKIVIKQLEGIGFGGYIWDAGLALCEYIANEAVFAKGHWAGRRGIELGSGTGLCGIVAAALDCDIVITDIGGHVALIEQNVKLNVSDKKNVAVAEYLWGTPATRFKPPFEVILASDVVYDSQYFDDLVDSFDKLSDQKTVIYLSAEKRKMKEVHFFRVLGTKFSYEKVADEFVGGDHRRKGISIYVIRRLPPGAPPFGCAVTAAFELGLSSAAASSAAGSAAKDGASGAAAAASVEAKQDAGAGAVAIAAADERTGAAAVAASAAGASAVSASGAGGADTAKGTSEAAIATTPS